MITLCRFSSNLLRTSTHLKDISKFSFGRLNSRSISSSSNQSKNINVSFDVEKLLKDQKINWDYVNREILESMK